MIDKTIKKVRKLPFKKTNPPNICAENPKVISLIAKLVVFSHRDLFLAWK